MKHVILIFFVFVLTSCNQQTKKEQELQNRIEQLETEVAESYKPGFGEMMGNIQSHHSKLWFAGKNANWQLAAFEVKELHEIIDDIKKYQKEREETAKMDMITPSIKSLNKAIDKKDLILFKKGFQQLTNDCNKCHQLTNFGYNVVKIPETSPFTNQDFKIVE